MMNGTPQELEEIAERSRIAREHWAAADAAEAGIQTAARICQEHPALRPPLIDGLLRQGESMNIVGASKAGKSWLIHGLAVSVANGLWWLGREVQRGRVLVIDNELHSETFAERLRSVCREIGNGASLEGIDSMLLRGVSDRSDIFGIAARLSKIKPGRYQLIAIDALYRALPAGTSESDNAAVMRVYNGVDEIARMTGAAIVLNHHASKGDQSNKSVTDVGSGAGSISRAADTHLIIRPHEDESLAVLEAVCRSWPKPEPKSIRFWWPLWELAGAEPVLKQAKPPAEQKQERTDRETREKILSALRQGPRTSSQLRADCGFGDARVLRGLSMLKDEIQTARKRKKSTRKIIEVYSLKGR
jgi:hypothetical protein